MPKIDIVEINNIIRKIIDNIMNSKEAIVNIIDNIRKEQESLMFEIAKLKNDIIKIIDEVDHLEKLDKQMRKRLVEVSSDFSRYTEKDIREVYERAYEIRGNLMSRIQEEKHLREKRDALELQLRKLDENIKSAEKVISQISVALKFLEGDILPAFEIDDKESEMLLGIKILEAQEYERARIARDIHDGPAQYVASAVMRADFLPKVIMKDIEEGLKEIDDLKIILKKALKEIRDTIFDLRPMSFDDLGLIQTIQEHVKSIIEETNININLRLKPVNDEIEPIIQIAAYRMIQEILNNIKKHSKARNVDVKLDYGMKYLMIVITDDGIGFDVEETLKKVKTTGENYGLLGIIDRVNQLQGEFHIVSKMGNGTTFKIKLPVNRGVIQDEGKD
ncbi:Signal transduction histidine-protein kinase/phosphatase DegS [Caloramator mitchellensis]|uniref:Oxygen sensor histidine kinase NreB n=1 Tax=Caloramator mitchellensis TaxID=908809 RepID=A0A0R3JVE9_CALMK|nr:sensor histidine kinase [Caloramator mitchellensis]KRQ86269.1 Signal transduction histidine-protein kinase/phosphatase DegS [Caloramator mitchellensis]